MALPDVSQIKDVLVLASNIGIGGVIAIYLVFSVGKTLGELRKTMAEVHTLLDTMKDTVVANNTGLIESQRQITQQILNILDRR